MADDHEEEIPRSSLEEQNDVAEIQIQMDNLKGRRRIENDQTSQRTEQKEGVPGRQSNQEIALLQVDPIQETKAFNVTRLKTQSSNEEIRNQMKFILKGDFKNIYARNLPLPAAVVLIDRANNISEEYSNILRTALDLIPCKDTMYLVNGLVETNIVNQDKETICVCSDRQINFIEGFTEFGTVYQAVIRGGVKVYDCIKYIVLLENASDMLPCLKILFGGNRNAVMSVSTGEYFKDDVPALFITNPSYFSNALRTFLQSLKINSEVEFSEEKLALVCRNYNLQDNDVKRLITKLKENIWKIDVYSMQDKSGFVDLHESITIALC